MSSTPDNPHPQPQGEAFDSEDLFSLDDDTPLPACPPRKPDDDQICEACQ